MPIVSLAELKRYAVRYDSMPLMVYREVAAHLACIPGVEAELEWRKDPIFRYSDSQIEALQIRQEADADPEQVQRVLDHYGTWQYSPLQD